MNNFEFYAVVLTHPDLFIFLLIGSIIFHVIIFKRIIYSIIDPFLLPVIANIFCFVVVYLLYFTNNTSFYTFLSYNLTQVAFFLGLFSFKKIKNESNKENDFIDNNVKRNHATIAFYFFSIIYLGSTAIIYITKGIPLFMQSRLETFAGGGGAGILGRITDVSSIFCLYTFFSIIKIDKFRFGEIPKYIILSLIFCTYFLSGGKANFLTVIFTFFCYQLFLRVKNGNYHHYTNFLKKNALKIFCFTSIFVLGIIYVQLGNQDSPEEEQLNPIFSLALRFLHSGDIFWYAYPNNIYRVVDGSHGFTALFNDTLGLLRIYNWQDLPTVIGFIFKNIHHPSDIPQGPNARHNIFGLIYYGFWGSMLFSYLLGIIISFIRFKLPLFLKNTTLNGFIFTYLFIKISALDTDPMLTITYLDNLIFIFPFLYVLYLITVEFIKINPMKNG
jgi:oligosaccharide repeat unit polymerase